MVHHLELRLDAGHLLGELGTTLHDNAEVLVAGDALRLLDRLKIGLHAPQLLTDEGDTLIDKVVLPLRCRILIDGAHTIVDLYQLGEEVLALLAVVGEDGERGDITIFLHTLDRDLPVGHLLRHGERRVDGDRELLRHLMLQGQAVAPLQREDTVLSHLGRR